MTQADPFSEQCTATAKGSGVRCLQPVIGGGVCRKHGGGAPQVKAAREARLLAARAQASGGVVVARDASEALLGAAQTADEILQRLCAPLLAGQKPSALELKAIGEWVDRGVRSNKTVLDARVDERKVRLTEAQFVQAHQLIAAVLSELGHDPDSSGVIEVVRTCAARLGAGGRPALPVVRGEVIVKAPEPGTPTDG